MATDKQYTLAEIEAMLNEATLPFNIHGAIRQLLARVKEYEEVESLLKECVIGHQGDYIVKEEGDGVWAVIEINDGETDSNEHTSLLSALQSLTKE